MKYNVGQVLYVVLKKETRVYPMQVVEEITKKTLTGEATTYMVKGGTNSNTLLLITDVDGEIFDSPEQAKAVLIARATTSINKLVAAAVQKAAEWYKVPNDVQFDDPLLLLKKTAEPHQQIKHQRHWRQDPVSEFHDELKNETNDTGDATFITLPDETRAKVKSVKLPDTLQ